MRKKSKGDGEDIDTIGIEDKSSDETASKHENEESSKESQEDEMKDQEDDIIADEENYHTLASSPLLSKEKGSSIECSKKRRFIRLASRRKVNYTEKEDTCNEYVKIKGDMIISTSMA